MTFKGRLSPPRLTLQNRQNSSRRQPALRLLTPFAAMLLAAVLCAPVTAQTTAQPAAQTAGQTTGQTAAQSAAQTAAGTPSNQSNASLTPAQAESLLVNPGDVLSIRVFGEPELSQPLRVNDAGDITEPFVGKVHVAGLAPSQIATELERQFVTQQYLLEPRINVTVDQYVTENVAVLGQVKLAGTFPTPTGRTITEVIAQAGGLLDTADRHIVIRRHTGGREVPFFFSNAPGPLLGDQPIVYPGDTVYVPKAGTVYMLGDVARAGGYIMNNEHSQLTALQLLSLAGGSNNTSRPSHARLVRQSPDGVHETPLPLDDIRKGLAPDVTLTADDIIYVPFSNFKNVLVSLPGIIASAASASVYVIK